MKTKEKTHEKWYGKELTQIRFSPAGNCQSIAGRQSTVMFIDGQTNRSNVARKLNVTIETN